MKKRRYTFWRWLLALLLGVGTWWGVGWWLSPKLQFETHYLVDDAVNRAKDAKEVKADAALDQLRNGIHWDSRIWDVAGRYLVIEEWLYSTLHFLDVIDLQIGKPVARHTSYPPELEMSSLRKTTNLARADGIIYLIKTTSGYTNSEEDRLNTPFQLVRSVFNRELWQWNVLTNEAKMLRKYPMKCSRSICHEGTTLLEIEQATPLLPSLLLPPSLPSILAGLSHAELGTNDLAIMRTSSLPGLTHLGTVVLPWMERQDNAQLSHDGRYLIIPDSATLNGFVSPTRITEDKMEGDGHHGHITSYDLYVSHPVGLRVFESASGRLWWESKGVQGIYRVCSSETNLLRFEQALRLRNGDTCPSLLLHLPSRKSYQPAGWDQLTPLDQSTIHFTNLSLDGENLRFDVHVMNEQGEHAQKVRMENVNDGHQLLPGAPQYLTTGQTKPATIDRLAEWLHSHEWFKDWQPAFDYEMCVVDYQKNRTLWSRRFPMGVQGQRMPFSLRSEMEPNATISDHQLLITTRDEAAFHLSAYALPFPSWSPWWARVAGLVVCLLVWVGITRIARQRDVLASSS
ncbi:MAG: hypothetical protein QM703_04090 [Gemmatales bacterium]